MTAAQPITVPATRAELRRRRALDAVAHLRLASPELGRLIEAIGPHRPLISPDPFRALIGAVIQQQLSMSAAATVYERLRDRCPRRRIASAALLSLRPLTLRKIGLSRQKAEYVHIIADAFASRRLTAAGLRRMSDEEVVEATTALKGVGRWTAEMLLIFCLERTDVWPVDDLGLKKAVRNFLGLSEFPPVAEMERLAEPWRPYRSYAAWYLWRSLEGPLMPGAAM